jgi:hypothetical protein
MMCRDKMKQFIKVIAIMNVVDKMIGFEYGFVNAESKDEAYNDQDFNDEVSKRYKDEKDVEIFNNDLVIDIQELRNNAGSSLNFGRQMGEKAKDLARKL